MKADATEWIYDPFEGADQKARDKDKAEKESRFRELRINTGQPNEAERKLAREVMKYRLAQMSLRSNKENVVNLRKIIRADIKTMSNPSLRNEMMDLIVSDGQELLKSNLAARIQYLALLWDLHVVEPSAGEDFEPQPYVPAYSPMLKAFVDPEQPLMVQLVALRGLMRIETSEGFVGNVRHEILTAVVDRMNKSRDEHPWMQWRLAEAIGLSKQIKDRAGTYSPVEALVGALSDRLRPFIVRAQAFHALTAMPLDAQVNTSTICYEAVALCYEMGMTYSEPALTPKLQKDAGFPQNAPVCAWLIYVGMADLPPAAGEDKTPGLLASGRNLGPHRAFAQRTYSQLLPFFNAMIPPTTPQAERIEKLRPILTELNTWLTTHQAQAATVSGK
jgi:hypothetical protein